MRYWRGTVGRPASTTTVSDDTVIVATPTPSATTITESEDKLYVYVQHVVDGTLLYPTANLIPDGPFMDFVVYRYEAVKKGDGSYETNPNVKGERLGGVYTELPIGNARDTEQVDNPGEYGNNIITDDAILKKIESIDSSISDIMISQDSLDDELTRLNEKASAQGKSGSMFSGKKPGLYYKKPPPPPTSSADESKRYVYIESKVTENGEDVYEVYRYEVFEKFNCINS